MSSALARAVNEKKSTRILRRDERKPVDESVASSGINRAGTKEVTKNPTRVVPELPGFHQLTKLEVTRDTRDIDKRSMLMNVNETDSEDELENAVPVTMRPPCNTDSLVQKKKNRLDAWVANKEQAEKDVRYIKEAAVTMRREFERIEAEQDLWCSSFEMGRGALTQSIIACREETAKLARDLKLLYNLTLAECGPSTRKRRTVSMRDAIAELQERKESLESKLIEYSKLATDAKGDKAPIISIELDETKDLKRLPEDAEAFKMLYGITDDKTDPAPVPALAHASAGDSKDKKTEAGRFVKAVSPANTNANASSGSSSSDSNVGDSAGEVKNGDSKAAKGSRIKEEKVDLTYDLEMQRGDTVLCEETSSKQQTANGKGNGKSGKGGSQTDTASSSGVSSSSSSSERGAEKRRATAADRKGDVAAAATSNAQSEQDKNDDMDDLDDDGDIGKHIIRGLVIQFNAAEEAVKTAQKQVGDIDIFMDNLDHNGMPPGVGGAGASSSSSSSRSSSSSGSSNNNDDASTIAQADQRMMGSMDRGSTDEVVEETLNEIRNFVEGSRERSKRSAEFDDRYNTGEKGWKEYLLLQAGENGAGRKRRKIASSIVVKSYVYARTPRGQPLLVSPLSQYEDKYLGVVMGGAPGSNLSNGIAEPATKYTIPRASDSCPPFLAAEEDIVMNHCSLQSACASSETKLRRLRNNLADWHKQLRESQATLDHAKSANEAATREDTIECKRIRRELQAFGISSTPLNTDTPLSPIAETSGWGKEGGEKKLGKAKAVGLGRGRASGSMAALQKGNNRKIKEWRGPPRHTMGDGKEERKSGNGKERDVKDAIKEEDEDDEDEED